MGSPYPSPDGSLQSKYLAQNPSLYLGLRGAKRIPPLRRKVIEHIRQASPDERNLAFEISEECLANWRESIPVVLETLTGVRL